MRGMIVNVFRGSVLGALLLMSPVVFALSDFAQQCEQLLHANQLAEVEQIAGKVAADAPNNAEAHYYLGVACIRLDKVPESVEQFEKAVALDSSNSVYNRALGDSYGRSAQKASIFSKLGWAKKCKAAYEKAIELDPKSIPAHAALANYFWLAPGMAGGGKDKAYAQIDEIGKFDAQAAANLRLSYYVMDKKYDEARVLIADKLKADADDYRALFLSGEVAALSGQDVDAGIVALKRCLALSVPAGAPDGARVNYELGNLYQRKGDKASARAAYEAALVINPQMKDAQVALAKVK